MPIPNETFNIDPALIESFTFIGDEIRVTMKTSRKFIWQRGRSKIITVVDGEVIMGLQVSANEVLSFTRDGRNIFDRAQIIADAEAALRALGKPMAEAKNRVAAAVASWAPGETFDVETLTRWALQ